MIQGTSKQWQVQQVVGLVMMLVGALWWMFAGQDIDATLESYLAGPVLIVTGLLLYVVGRIMASRYRG